MEGVKASARDEASENKLYHFSRHGYIKDISDFISVHLQTAEACVAGGEQRVSISSSWLLNQSGPQL